MPASKIQDHAEVRRWFEEGYTYAEMVQMYLDKYHITTTPAMWGNYRVRHDLPRRITRDDELIPWAVKLEHRHDYPILMLRKEARRRAGFPMSDDDLHAIEVWILGMTESGTVVHYEPETEKGWFYVERRPGVDLDLIREPGRSTGRKAAD